MRGVAQFVARGLAAVRRESERQRPNAATLPPTPATWSLPSGHGGVATQQDIFYCFRLLLGRRPNPEEWPGHSARAGETLEDVVASFVTSREFAARGLLGKTYAGTVQLVQLDGFSLFASNEDLAIGRHIVAAGCYEPAVAAVLRRYLRPGMTVVDIGANIGYLTMLMATLVGDTGCVVAVEPNPENVRLLEASRRVNGFRHVVPIQAAAGRGTGLLALNASFSNGMTGELPHDPAALFAACSVPCFALDAILPDGRPTDLIKIDVEGAELNALIGLENTIRSYHPVIVTEFSPGQMPGISGCSGPEYLQHIIDRGYRLAVIEEDGSETMFGSDIDAVMAAYSRRGIDHIDITAVPV
jgi:FkbM family methyltransferase